MQLNAQELATVLAALRHFQLVIDARSHQTKVRLGSLTHPEWSEYFAAVRPLTSGQIDSLCERLNTEGLNA